MDNKGDFMEGEDITKTETIKDFIERLNKLRDILLDYSSKHSSVLVVCHWWVVKYLTSTNQEQILSGASFYGDGINLENGGMTLFTL